MWRLRTLPEINARGIEEVIPERVGRHNHTTIAISEDGDLMHAGREGDILGQPHGLRPVALEQGCSGHGHVGYTECISQSSCFEGAPTGRQLARYAVHLHQQTTV